MVDTERFRKLIYPFGFFPHGALLMRFKITKKIFLPLALALAGEAHADHAYTLDWIIGGDEIFATFNGTANGNVITNLSNISVFFDGIAFSGNGNLYANSINDNATGWSSTGAQISFDGQENNFVFSNTDFSNNLNFTNYFYDFSKLFPGTNEVVIGHNDVNGDLVGNGSSDLIILSDSDNSGYSITAVPEPGQWAMMLLGLPLIGWAVLNRKDSLSTVAAS
jgi:hypothetical protein